MKQHEGKLMREDVVENGTRKGSLAGRIAGLLALMTLAGCETLLPKGPAETQGPVEQPTETTQPAEPDPITGALPTDTERHRVALLLPLSGRNSGIGQSIANATTLALLDAKAENLRITSYDTAKGARAAAQKAIADGNRLILGPLLSENVIAAAEAARPANVPIISYSNDIGVAGGNVFLLGYMPNQSIDRVVKYARSRGMSRFAGLVPNGTYGQRASSQLLRSVKDAGGTVVTMQKYNRSAASMRSAVQRMQQDSAYDAILIADSGNMAINAQPIIARNGGANAKLLGTELWNTESKLASAPGMRGAWFASVSDNLYRQYATKYRGMFGTNPYRLSSLGYDSVLLTIRIARDWKVGQGFPVDRLKDDGGFVGLDGAFRFTGKGTAERALEVQEIGSGSINVVSTAPRSFK